MLNLSGKRLGVNKCKVQVCGNGQFTVTIPRGIAAKQGLVKGSVLRFENWRDKEFRVFKEDSEVEK